MVERLAGGRRRFLCGRSEKSLQGYRKLQENFAELNGEGERAMAGDAGRRTIKLFCPSVSKIVEWVAWNDQKLDFRAIAGAFGLEPSTVKLNGHFISRGIDLLATCVTWQSLLAFFSAKGLSTGKHEADALLVHGKLCRVGTKRAHSNPQEDLTCNDVGLIRNKKLKYKCSAGENLISGCNKRKLLSEDTHLLKKLKLNLDDSFEKIPV